MDTLALTPELEPMSWRKMLEQMGDRESRGARVSALTKRDSAEMASQQVMAQGGRSSRGARHAGQAERNGCANKQMPGRLRQIAAINFGVRALASFPVCHATRPKRIGSGNRRLGTLHLMCSVDRTARYILQQKPTNNGLTLLDYPLLDYPDPIGLSRI